MANIDINRLLLRYRVASISTLILGIALSTLAFVAVDSRERGALRTAFDDAAAHVQSAITLALQRNVYMADSVGALFDSSNDTTHPQFVVFTKQLLTHMRGVQALEWIPLVPSAMRNSYEKAAQEAFPRFEFTERKAQGEMVRAAARDEYFPVYFVEPVVGNQAAIGFDLGSNPVRLEALTRARDTGQIVATERITLVQEMATEYGILLFRPVYRAGLPHDTNEQRHNNLLGFALGVFRIGEVINAATGPLKSSGINAVIYDDSAPTSERFLASWPAMTQTDPSQAEQAQGKPERERIESFDVGGRRWTLVLTPTKALYSTTVPRVAWVMLMAGLLFSGLLAAYIEAARKHLREELGSREARLAAEEKLTDILGSIDSAVVSIKPSTGELLYANRAAVQILGRSPAELAKNNKLWLDAVHPDDKRNIYERLSLPQKTSSFSDEFRFIRPSGEVRWVGSKAKVVPDATGNVARIDIVASDITEQRQAKEERRRSEEKFKSLFNATSDAIIILRTDGQLVEVNDAAVTQLGYSREELLQMTPADFDTPEFAAAVPKRIAEIACTGRLIAETANVTKDGRIIPTELHARAIEYDGAPAILTALRDITERKKGEDKLRKAELRYRSLFEQAPVGVVIIDLDTGLAAEFNDLAHNQLGYSREEFGRLNVSDYEAVERPEEIKAHMDRILRQGKETFETQHRTKSGELRYMHIMMRLLNSPGQRYLYCIYQDVTEQRKSELALERSNRALRTISAGNEELVRATSESELLDAICRVIVEKGGYRTVGVCYAQDNLERSVKPMAWAGTEECCVAEEIQPSADADHGETPISRTIRSGKPEVVRDILKDPTLARWRDAAVKHGYASILALPLSDATRVFGGLCVYASEPDAFDEEETHLLEELANDLAYGISTLRTKADRDRIAHEHQHHEEILRKSLEQSIQAIADTVEMRDPYTAGHQRRVGELAAAIAQELGLSDDKIHGLRLAASIHDLGKIKVPAEILAKPGKLTNIELMLIKAHAQAGYDILKDIAFPWPIATIVWQHHERLDGSGYPLGLKDDQILFESRIMAVADVVEAMASHRPYRPSLGMEATLAEIERGRGSAYDPAVVNACLKVIREGRFAFTN